ncbi:MAG: RNA-guided pseudouridylation complex pseudouridine synthase subunit Cbf5 [Candidatus Hodarchaeales archaeon]|jgi:H/ACA ribonucleoprotein complex subunit 4
MLPSDFQREIIVKADCETNPEWGKSPEKRSIPELLELGIVNIDKPANPTSHEVAVHVRNIFGVKKTGHGGTLDPAVTGCLPIALETATKSVSALLPAGKEYVCLMKLHANHDEERIHQVLQKFSGMIYQVPPLRSSVKRQLRKRKIYYLEVYEILDRLVLFKVGCQAGTYIRKLCHDVGLVLGKGGNMKELRRTRSGPFREENSFTLQECEDAMHYYREEGKEKMLKEVVQPVERAVDHLGRVYLRDSAVDAVCHGGSITAPGISKLTSGIKRKDFVAIMTLKNELIGLGYAVETSQKMLELNRGIMVKLNAVIMKRKTYPSLWNKDLME